MQMQDKQIFSEQKLQGLSDLIAQEDYIGAIELSQQLDKDIQQLFAQQSEMQTEHVKRLQDVAADFSALVSTLSIQRQQIKDSLGQIAAVKSANKISKTYKID
mgnify:CR=1 FL=1